MLRIMGKSKATVEQLQTYIKKVNPKVTDSVTKLAAIYIAEGEAEGVRGDIAFAQSCLETGNICRMARNPGEPNMPRLGCRKRIWKTDH